jgi:hypothetical protein
VVDVRKVDTLPVLDTDQYGELPEIPEGTVLALFSTPWRQAEPEFMAAAMIQACIDAGEWRPIAANMAFVENTLMRFPNFHFMPQSYWNGLAVLREQGDVEMVEFEGGEYAILQPSLARKALASGGAVMYDYAYAKPTGNDQPTEPITIMPPRGGLMNAIRRVLNRLPAIS